MKALTIWQPWASLIMIGAKPFEFRGWDYRTRERKLEGQRIVIHAGARKMVVSEIADLLNRLGNPDEDHTGLDYDKARTLLQRVWDQPRCAFQMLPLGAGLGTAIIGRPRNAGTIFGGLAEDSGEFNWAWPLTGLQSFEPSIPMRGAQGFWSWPASAEGKPT